MPVLKIAGASILALGLILGLALPGLATPDEAPAWADDFQIRIVKGKVTGVNIDEEGEGYFKIQSGEEEPIIFVDGDTRYFKLGVPGRIVSLARHRLQFRLQNQIFQPEDVSLSEPQRAKLKWLRPFGEESEFSDIEVGDRVVVWAEESSELLAKRVLIIKPTTYARVNGTIDISLGNETIIITPDGGDPVPLTYNESTVFILRGVIEVEQWQYAHAIYDSANMLAKRVTVSSTGG